jgi:hypothetical protein
MATKNMPKPETAPAVAEPLKNSLTEPFEPLSTETTGQVTEYLAELKRNQVLQIIESYHHDFDHFYESIQNAVDACQRAFSEYEKQNRSAEYTPRVDVEINLKTNRLTVIDNGPGMSSDVVRKFFFTPYATLKNMASAATQPLQRGEKGVGATFLSYGSDYVHLSTITNGREMNCCKLEGGLSWCKKKLPLFPLPTVKPYECHGKLLSSPHGTAVELQFSEDTNIRDLSEYGRTAAQWEAVLRLHTALGFIDPQANDQFLKSLRATLTIISADGSAASTAVNTGYFYPHLATDSNVQLSKLVRTKGQLPESQRDMNILWDSFTADQVASVVTERMEHSKYLRSSTRQIISQILSQHKPEAYVAFAYSSDFWGEANDRIWGQELEGQFRHGIVFATKSQKIGEQKRIDFKFRSGDFNRFFVLLNMRDLRADIGRKSLPEEVGEFANFLANSVQGKFVDQDDCLRPSPGPFAESLEKELEEMKDRAVGLPKINLEGLHFTREPREEQDVVALFFDLLGMGKLRGFDVYSTHISRTYDGIGQFFLKDISANHYDAKANPLGVASDRFQKGEVRSPSKNFLEFKYTTDGLVNDVRSGYKRLQDIKWLVCWEIGEKHTNEGIGITDITQPAQVNKRDYYGVTHLMTESQAKVFVVCLKKVLELLNAAKTST